DQRLPSRRPSRGGEAERHEQDEVGGKVAAADPVEQRVEAIERDAEAGRAGEAEGVERAEQDQRDAAEKQVAHQKMSAPCTCCRGTASGISVAWPWPQPSSSWRPWVRLRPFHSRAPSPLRRGSPSIPLAG